MMDRWCFEGSVSLPEAFASTFGPHQREGVAWFPAYREIKDKGTCAGSSGLIGLGCSNFSSRSVLGEGYLYDYLTAAMFHGLVTRRRLTTLPHKTGSYCSIEHASVSA